MLREISDKVDSADLSQYDLSRFQPMSFEFEPKLAALTMHAPAGTAAGGLEA
ncbi:MAG: hypothetical protein ACYDCW_07400 [Acidithiobacillus ferrivorans]